MSTSMYCETATGNTAICTQLAAAHVIACLLRGCITHTLTCAASHCALRCTEMVRGLKNSKKWLPPYQVSVLPRVCRADG